MGSGSSPVDARARRRRTTLLLALGGTPLLLATCCGAAGFGFVRRVTHMYGYPAPTWDYTEVYAPSSPWRTSTRPFVHVSFNWSMPGPVGGGLPYRTVEFGSPYRVGVSVEDPSERFTHARCSSIDLRIGAQAGWRSLPLVPRGLQPPDAAGWCPLFRNNPLPGKGDWQIGFGHSTGLEIPPGRELRIRVTIAVRDREGAETEHSIEGEATYRRFETTKFVVPMG